MEFNSSTISQNQLEKIFILHFNDLFNKFLATSFQQISLNLKNQVSYHLQIIGKHCENSLFSFIYNQFYNLCKNEQIRIKNVFEKLQKNNHNLKFLNINDIHIHCFKCKEALHKCRNKLVVFEDLYFCLRCKKVYNKNQIKLYCKECEEIYFTTERNDDEIKNKNFYKVSFMKYHCFNENEEEIKCLECGHDLYYNINKIRNEEVEKNRIIDIICIKCKLIYNTTKLYFKCNFCGENFKCQPQIYKNFSSTKKYIILLVHAFRKGKYALPLPNPEKIINKNCNCNLKGVLYFMHDDNGILYETKIKGNKVIVCDNCYRIYKFNDFKWSCPFCGIKFKMNNNENSTLSNNNRCKKIHIIKNNLENRTNEEYNNDYYDYIFPLKEKTFNNQMGLKKINLCLHKRELSLNNKNLNFYSSFNHDNRNNNSFHNNSCEKYKYMGYNDKNMNYSYYRDFNNSLSANYNIQKNFSLHSSKNSMEIKNSQSSGNLNESDPNLSMIFKNNNYKNNKYININYSSPSSIMNTSKKNSKTLEFWKNEKNHDEKIYNRKEQKVSLQLNQNKNSNNNNVLYESKYSKNKNKNHKNSMVIQDQFNFDKNENTNFKTVKDNQLKKLHIMKINNKNTKRKDIKYVDQNKKDIHINNTNNTSENFFEHKIIYRSLNNSKNKKSIFNEKYNENNKEITMEKNKIDHAFTNNFIHFIKNNKNYIHKKYINQNEKNNNLNITSKNNILLKTINVTNNTRLFIDNNTNNYKLSLIYKDNFYQPIHRKNNLSININNLDKYKIVQKLENTKLHCIIEKNKSNKKILSYKEKNINQSNICDSKNNRSNNKIICNNSNQRNNISSAKEDKKNVSSNEEIKKILPKTNNLVIKEIKINQNNKGSNIIIKNPCHIVHKTDNKQNENSKKNKITKISYCDNKNKLNFELNNNKFENQKDEDSKKDKKGEKIVNLIDNDFKQKMNTNINDNIEENNSNKFFINDTTKEINQNQNNHIENELIYKKIDNIRKPDIEKLKIYFSENIRLNDLNNPKRKSSFDCRLSTSHFKLFASQDIEQKTFDSNNYQIIRQIGKGAYGEIYLVQDPKDMKLYALKKIIINDATDLRDNQEEYKLTWKLTHINPELKIVKKYGIEIKKLDKYNIVMYILMEVSNCDWENEILNRQKAKAYYSEIEILTILKSLVKTFQILQTMGISHRDVKPQNILCFGSQGYKLTDFGEAKNRKINKSIKKSCDFEQNTIKQTLRGTELYMSPILFKSFRNRKLECLEYNAYKNDVFSLGMCFLLASSLTYQSIFDIREVTDMKIIEENIHKYLGKLYSKNYIDIINKMLQIDEKLRPDFIELNHLLDKY